LNEGETRKYKLNIKSSEILFDDSTINPSRFNSSIDLVKKNNQGNLDLRKSGDIILSHNIRLANPHILRAQSLRKFRNHKELFDSLEANKDNEDR